MQAEKRGNADILDIFVISEAWMAKVVAKPP